MEERDDRLRSFKSKTGIEPRFEPAIQFATRAYVCAKLEHDLRVVLGHVAASGFGEAAPDPPLYAPRLYQPGAKYGGILPELYGNVHLRRITSLISQLLFGMDSHGSVAPLLALENEIAHFVDIKQGARVLLRDYFDPLGSTNVLGPKREGPSVLAKLRFVVALRYLWQHQGRPTLSAPRLHDLAFGFGFTDARTEVSRTWGGFNRDAARHLAKFDPAAPPGSIDDESARTLFDLLAEVTNSIRRGEMHSRPSHSELTRRILAATYAFDAVALARGRASSIIL